MDKDNFPLEDKYIEGWNTAILAVARILNNELGDRHEINARFRLIYSLKK